MPTFDEELVMVKAKRASDEVWIEGYYCRASFGSFPFTPCVFAKDELDKGRYEPTGIIPETVSRFTGLYDKNSKKIYKNDIVKYKGNLFQITFENGSFALLDKTGNMFEKIGGLNDYCYPLMDLADMCNWIENAASDLERVGNIFDNLDLL